MISRPITVLMTTYNCAPYIKQAIKSILNQSFKHFQLLIVDDGSIDDTKSIVHSIDDERIDYRIIEHCGRSQVLNYGMSVAKYNWISIMDADDIAHPLRLEKQISTLTGNENEICFTDAAFFKGSRILYTITNDFKSKTINEVLALHGHFVNSTFIFNKNHILKLGGYNESIKVFEDYDLWLRIKEKSKILFIAEILQFARIRKNSLTNSDRKQLNKIFYRIQEKYYLDLAKNFGITEDCKQQRIKGWREYFYGNKNLAKGFWLKIKLSEWDFRMVLAFIMSFFPEFMVNNFNSLRLRLRLEYFFNRSGKFKGLDSELRKLLFEIDK